MDENYKKSYKGFVLWLVLFFAVHIFGAEPLISMVEENYSVYASLSLTLIFLDILTYVIYKTEYIYWYNGMSYDTARKASSGARKEYAHRHLIKFVYASIMWLFYGILKSLTGIKLWVDVLVFCALIIGAALSTITVRLEDN
ncbi:MAG: hypothetical protein E7218_01385 [Anaerofustis stercorihominis]|nr:hypothetical protein [Anaerofustis stercorihominis]